MKFHDRVRQWFLEHDPEMLRRARAAMTRAKHGCMLYGSGPDGRKALAWLFHQRERPVGAGVAVHCGEARAKMKVVPAGSREVVENS